MLNRTLYKNKKKIFNSTKKYRFIDSKGHSEEKYYNVMEGGGRMNCSPAVKGKTLNSETCYTPSILIKIRNAYNKRKPRDQRILSKDPNVIWTELRARLTKCSSEDCWLKEIKSPKLRSHLDDLIFSPDKPPEWSKNPNEWLSNFDIASVLKQYQITHREFKLLGPSSIDYDTKPPEENGQCVWPELCRLSLRDLIAHGKRKLGIVFNLDKHDEPGSHWVSMFVDVDNSFIFYYDSARNNTPTEVTRLKNEITKQGAALSPPIHFKYITNKHSHQRTNTECGMYSLFFIITMLTGKTDHPIESFTPLKIYNGTPFGRLNRDLRATLPINELKGKPPTEVCPILNLHRCKKRGHGGEQYGGIREHNLSVEQRISLFLDHNIPDKYVESYRNKYFN